MELNERHARRERLFADARKYVSLYFADIGGANADSTVVSYAVPGEQDGSPAFLPANPAAIAIFDSLAEGEKVWIELHSEETVLNDLDGAFNFELEAFDSLAGFLTNSLIHLKDLKRREVRAPVRHLGAIPHSLISDLAFDAVETYQAANEPLSGPIVDFLAELLGQLGSNDRHAKHYRARKEAVFLYAQREPSLREAAQLVGVHHTTISRWLKEEEFLSDVEEVRQSLKRT